MVTIGLFFVPGLVYVLCLFPGNLFAFLFHAILYHVCSVSDVPQYCLRTAGGKGNGFLAAIALEL